MTDATVLRLTVALSDESRRHEAAERLSHHIGAEAMLLLVRDDVAGVLLPAPGFAPTLPGGETWARFLRTLQAPGVHRAQIAYPTPAARHCRHQSGTRGR